MNNPLANLKLFHHHKTQDNHCQENDQPNISSSRPCIAVSPDDNKLVAAKNRLLEANKKIISNKDKVIEIALNNEHPCYTSENKLQLPVINIIIFLAKLPCEKVLRLLDIQIDSIVAEMMEIKSIRSITQTNTTLIKSDRDGNFIELLDLLYSKISSINITQEQSFQAFCILKRIYKELPVINNQQIYSKCNKILEFLLPYQQHNITQLLLEKTDVLYKNSYFNLYIEGNISHNNFLKIINKIYKNNKIPDFTLLEKTMPLIIKNITDSDDTAKNIFIANEFIKIIENFNLDEQRYFVDKLFSAVSNDKHNKFFDFIYVLLQQNNMNAVLKKYTLCETRIKKANNKMAKTKTVVDINMCNTDVTTTEIKNSNLKCLYNIDFNKIEKMSLDETLNYLYKQPLLTTLVESKKIIIYTKLLNLLSEKIQDITNITEDQSYMLFNISSRLFKRLPYIDFNSSLLHIKIYDLFNNLLTYNSDDIIEVIQQNTQRICNDAYFKISNNYLAFICNLYEHQYYTEHNLIEDVLPFIKKALQAENITTEKSSSTLDYFYYLQKIIKCLPSKKQKIIKQKLFQDAYFSQKIIKQLQKI